MDVIGTDEFAAWFEALPESEAEAVAASVTLLESLGAEQACIAEVGVFPHLGLQKAGVRLFELSVRDRTLRVLFAVERAGNAVLLYGYDAASEAPGAMPGRVTGLAHAVLATKVFWMYRDGGRRRA